MSHSDGQHFSSYADMPAALHARLEVLAYHHGRTYDSYLVTEDNRECFWSLDRRGVVGFVRSGRYAYVIGGLIADESDKNCLIEQFSNFARQERFRVVTFCNLLRDDAERLRAAGFQITKCGEEPLVDLEATAWKGKEYQWVRRQENFSHRHGLVVREVIPGGTGEASLEAVADELQEISTRHILTSRHGYEMQYFVGRFRPEDVKRRRIFVAGGNGRIEAFVLCNPGCGGKLWAIEMYRRRADAPRGVIPFTMMQTLRRLKAEGVTHASLALAPCVRCEQAIPGDSRLVRNGHVFWWRYLNWIFDMRGIYHFKSRFRPEFRDMYYAAYPKLTILSMRAFMRTWGISMIGPFRLVRSGLGTLRKKRQRGSLAEPRPGGGGQLPAERPVTGAVPNELSSLEPTTPNLQCSE